MYEYLKSLKEGSNWLSLTFKSYNIHKGAPRSIELVSFLSEEFDQLELSHPSSKVQSLMKLNSKFNSSWNLAPEPYYQSSKLRVNSNFEPWFQ